MGPKKVTTKTIEYPPDCKEISTELSKDELHRRLKQLAKVIQDIGQDDEHLKYTGLAQHMSSEEFLDHESKDVKLLVACILADVFRIFAPEHPFGNTEKLKDVLVFLIDQLQGLGSPDSHNYKRYYYLLENLTYAKTFTVCLDWETDDIVLHLLNTVFGSLTDKHSDKVLTLLLDALSSVLSDADSVSIPLLDAIFVNIVEPNKLLAKEAYELAKKVLRRNSASLAGSIMNFFNQVMMLGNTTESEVGEKGTDILFELYQISPTLITSIIPFLDQKLKVNEVSERKSIIRLLGRLFADKNSDLMETQADLWQSYLGRYHDIETEIRVMCIEQAEVILTNHPSAKTAISEHWNRRHRDADDNVRCAVVQAIVNTCKKGLSYVTEEMLQCVRERCLDKKFKIRKEALTGLGHIFRKYAITEDGSLSDLETIHKIPIQWIQNRILQTYFQRLLDDKFMVERLFLQCIVPFSLNSENRMRRLLTMFAYIDDNSRKAFSTMLKAQTQLRKLVKELVDLCAEENTPKLVHQVAEQAIRISKHYPDSGNKVAEGLKKFFVSLIYDRKSREIMDTILDPKCSCETAAEKSKSLQSKLAGSAIPPGQIMAVKVLLERIAPLLIDQSAVDVLVQYVCDCLTGSCDFMESFDTPYEAGMSLLVCIAPEYPQAFDSEATFNNLTEFLKHENDAVSSAALQILMNTGSTLKTKFPDTCEHLLQTLQSMVKIGSARQAKHAVRCLANMFDNKEELFDQIAGEQESAIDNVEPGVPPKKLRSSTNVKVAIEKPVMQKICVICCKERKVIYKKGVSTVDKLHKATTLNAGRLKEVAEQNNDRKILVHFIRDAVASEMCYHNKCYKDYTREKVKEAANEVNTMMQLPSEFCDEVIGRRIINDGEYLPMTALLKLHNQYTNTKLDRTSQLKKRLGIKYPDLVFDKPKQQNQSAVVFSGKASFPDLVCGEIGVSDNEEAELQGFTSRAH